MAQVQVADALGRKVYVPEHWLRHPVLKRGFRPLASDGQPTDTAHASTTPDETWTHAQLDQHAADHGIDLAGATTKAEKLAAIDNPSQEG